MANGASRAPSGLIWRADLPNMLRPMREGVSASCVALPSQQSGPWRTALDFLAERFPAISREVWSTRMSGGEVSNEAGESVTAQTPFVPHQKIYYFRSVVDEPHIPFEETVLYQDEYIVVADKPHFLPVVPAGRFVQETLLVRLKRKLGIATLAPTHRIDRDTAGLVLFTIQPKTRSAYHRLFSDHLIEKRYEAIAGFSDELSMPVTRRSRLAEGPAFMQMQEIPGTPNAETHIDIIQSLRRFARYALRPVTGQKHQLRAHMAALGIPIVNDRIYPNLLSEAAGDDYLKPLQLLAKEIAFDDPITGQSRRFSSQQRLMTLETDVGDSP